MRRILRRKYNQRRTAYISRRTVRRIDLKLWAPRTEIMGRRKKICATDSPSRNVYWRRILRRTVRRIKFLTKNQTTRVTSVSIPFQPKLKERERERERERKENAREKKKKKSPVPRSPPPPPSPTTPVTAPPPPLS
ncbi:hypothetical protein RND81_06G146900 [Saponaria officinalis]|uniref:Uncharacterized protein n=1 Tax=Saponaria officinalis TaxID=3572 RepID=A0AAW1KAL1_SAPOF